jgi:hypothetical protein
MTRAEAKAIDLVAGTVLLVMAVATVVHAISRAEPLFATALGYFRAAEG